MLRTTVVPTTPLKLLAASMLHLILMTLMKYSQQRRQQLGHMKNSDLLQHKLASLVHIILAIVVDYKLHIILLVYLKMKALLFSFPDYHA